jgi:excisionase family DNA binding protein
MKEEIKPNAVYTAQEAAQILSLNHLTVLKYIRAGKLQATKLGERWYRISGQALLQFMQIQP